MHQLIDKKNKIIIYLLLLFILSTTSGKFILEESITDILSKTNQINIEGLVKRFINQKFLSELNNLFYKNILLTWERRY